MSLGDLLALVCLCLEMFAVECFCAHSRREFCKTCLQAVSGKASKATYEFPERNINVEWEEALLSSGYSSANGVSCESLPDTVASDHSDSVMTKKLLKVMHRFSTQKHFSWSVDYRQPYLLLGMPSTDFLPADGNSVWRE